MAKRYVLGASAARGLTRLLRGTGEVSSRPGSVSAISFDADYVAPFTVQWAQSVADGDGGWIIWLPSSELVVILGDSIDPSAELSAAGGDYPSGWYLLTSSMLSAESGGTLYLNITVGDDPSAEFSASAADSDDEGGEGEDEEKKFSVPICSASVNSQTGVRMVKQFVTSAILVGGGDETGVDDISVGFVDGGESGESSAEGDKLLEIKGWSTQQSSGTTLVDALGLNKKSDDEGGGVEVSGGSGGGGSRQVLIRNGVNGAIEYMDLGQVSGKGDGDDEGEEEDPCSHDDQGPGGGVDPADGGGGGGGGGGGHHGGGGGGGVPGGGGNQEGGAGGCNC